MNNMTTGITGHDAIKTIIQQTGLSKQRAKDVYKKTGINTGYLGRELSKEKQKELLKKLPAVIKQSGYKVRGVGDEYRFRQKIKKGLTATVTPATKNEDNKKALKSAADFLAKVRQGVPGSKEAESKEPQAATEGSHVQPQRVPLSDNFANIEAIASHEKGSEPVAPDIG